MKCDGIRPTCGQCRKRDQGCTWDSKPRMRGKGKKTIAAELARQQATAMAVAAAQNGGIVQVPMTPFIHGSGYGKVGLGIGLGKEDELGQFHNHHPDQSQDFRSSNQNSVNEFSQLLPFPSPPHSATTTTSSSNMSIPSSVMLTQSRSRGRSDPGSLLPPGQAINSHYQMRQREEEEERSGRTFGYRLERDGGTEVRGNDYDPHPKLFHDIYASMVNSAAQQASSNIKPEGSHSPISNYSEDPVECPQEWKHLTEGARISRHSHMIEASQ
jgi:hypothetical protein